MTLSEAIRIAYGTDAPIAPTQYERLQYNLAMAIVDTWSASCGSDRYIDLAPYREAERQARKALDTYLAETSDYLPSHC